MFVEVRGEAVVGGFEEVKAVETVCVAKFDGGRVMIELHELERLSECIPAMRIARAARAGNGPRAVRV